ncbi:hypothetical protein COLO4_34402 [Corchorus olitorius]|uniref:Uncharacterized protein n=1 Tax=Corchorus olitorius TaxID=93759 RepID=A0A1R3GKW4_9ROSI|nr:hypothetical protein COLO4_34402 [Corchorus olitorius]
MWTEVDAPIIGDVGLNIYSIAFSSEAIMRKALEDSPWSIMGHCLNLKVWPPLTSANNIEFKGILFWVQVHNLPRELLTKTNGEKIGGTLGTVVDVEEPRISSGMKRGFLRKKEIRTGLTFELEEKSGDKARNLLVAAGERGNPGYLIREEARASHFLEAREKGPSSKGKESIEISAAIHEKVPDLVSHTTLSLVSFLGRATNEAFEKEELRSNPRVVELVNGAEELKVSKPNLSPSKIFQSMLNLSNVFRRLNLKRLEIESEAEQGEWKRLKPDPKIAEISDCMAERQIVPFQHPDPTDSFVAGTGVIHTEKTGKGRRKWVYRKYAPSNCNALIDVPISVALVLSQEEKDGGRFKARRNIQSF